MMEIILLIIGKFFFEKVGRHKTFFLCRNWAVTHWTIHFEPDRVVAIAYMPIPGQFQSEWPK